MNIRKVLIILFFLLISQKVKSQEVEQKGKDSIQLDPVSPSNQKFSKANLLAYIKEIRIQYPFIVLRQGIHESGHFKSRIFKENNNVFGMRKPVKRTSTAIGTNRGYAVYKTWKDSVIDYLLFQNRFIYKIDNENEYLHYLNKNYSAVGKLYSKRLLAIPL